jgi:S1-C subfamily serine protease
MRQVLWLAVTLQVLSLALVSGCCSRPAVQVPRGPAVTQQELAVEITRACATSSGVAVGFGSGALISESGVLTAGHVVFCPGVSTIVVTRPGAMHVAQVHSLDLEGDMAILVLDSKVPGVPVAKIGPRPKVRDRVCVATARPERARPCGMITGYDTLPGDVRHTARTVKGNSGSGVYDLKGRLVGIATHACRDGSCGMFTALEGRVDEVGK